MFAPVNFMSWRSEQRELFDLRCRAQARTRGSLAAPVNFMSWRSDQRERVHELARERHSLPVVPAAEALFAAGRTGRVMSLAGKL